MNKSVNKKPKVLQVVQLGQKVLRTKAKEVKDPKAPEVSELIENLLATCKDFNGTGIAAPQVDESVRVFIVASSPSPSYPKAPNMKPTPMINPRILKKSLKKDNGWEGCLSVPGIRSLVPRHVWINIEYTDRRGNLKKAKYSDFLARVFQHELDHIDGILFVDRAKSSDMVTEKEYQRLMREKKANEKKKK